MNPRTMNYQIVATLGPATDEQQMWGSLVAAGATAFRLNTAHFRLDILQNWLEAIAHFLAESPAGNDRFPERAASVDADAFPVILDLQASKWRIGNVKSTALESGASVQLVLETEGDEQGDRSGSDPGILPIPHPDLFTAAQIDAGGEIAVNDGKVMLRIESPGKRRITARVTRGGEISARKGISLVGSEYRVEHLHRNDMQVLEMARRYPFVRYALSYVKDGVEMSSYRRLFQERGAGASYLIAKVERASALEDAEQIAGNADELWICRGDLGAEVGAAAMAEKLYRFLPRIRRIPKPVFLAGQVLEHLTSHPTPTRSEISYLYEALQRGFAGVVLSDETAVGAYPLESCRVAALFRSG